MTINEAVNHPEATLVDVRTPMEHSLETLAGSINIPMDEVPSRVEEFKNMSRPLVLFCRSGARSGQTLAFLAEQGITDAMNGGGYMDMMIHKM